MSSSLASRNVNSGVLPSESSTFSCSQCSKEFNRRENLSRHLKNHDAAPSHPCSKCDKAFTRSDLLKRHERGHERWDTKGIPEGSAKRRKVAFEDDQIVSSSSPWTLEDQQDSETSCSPQAIYREVQDTFDTSLQPPRNSDPSSNQFICPQSSFASQSLPSARKGSHQISQHHLTEDHLLPDVDQLAFVDNHLSNLQRLEDTEYLPFGPFDFSSFLLRPDNGSFGTEWFSNDFYSAVRETGNEWGDFGELLDPNFSSPGQDHEISFTSNQVREQNVSKIVPENEHVQEWSEESNGDGPPGQGRISRISSPPNEASEEDKWPFQWNPNSRPILSASPIVIPDDHPLLQNHYLRFDISEGTLLRLRAFLMPPVGHEFHQSQKGTLLLPSLAVINVFIGLFFEHFSPQMPVLHHATVNTNHLPPPLLAAIIIIGAIYSHLKHTRRFSIVLLDIVRWNLQIALECDNSLLREPMIIFAEALICHTGLWCGNKRTFELAEVVRGAAVTHIRRVHFTDRLKSTAEDLRTGNINAQWRQWVAEESQRRLYWTIYALDAQFPSLLNLPATIAIGEVTDLGCPCDEEFWSASSARNWKNLLGRATIPPSRSFSAAVGSFVLSTQPRTKYSRATVSELPILDLNPWSAFLVLMTVQNRIFQYTQDSLLARTFLDDEEPDGQQFSHTSIPSVDDAGGVSDFQLKRRQQLADSLSSWYKAYSAPRPSTTSHPTSHHFHAASIVVYHLGTILLDIELSDLQNAIGKDGTAGMSQAMSLLSHWARKSPELAEGVAFNAVKTIVSLAPSRSFHDNSAPYSIITLFLCHVVLWVYASVSLPAEKQQLMEVVEAHEGSRSSRFLDVLRTAMSGETRSITSGTRDQDAPKVLFKSAAEMLTQLGTWGASLNLALLIQRRAEMQ